MNVNDVKIAAEDLVEANIASPLEGVYVKGLHGAEHINGFDVVEANEFAGVFVLDSSGEPAVSSRVIKEKDAEIERLRTYITGLDVHCVVCGEYHTPTFERDHGLYYCIDCGGDSE